MLPLRPVGAAAPGAYDLSVLEEANPTPPLSSRLSGRELEVLEMAASGMTNSQVAAKLDLSVHAIKFHLASIYRKLGVWNRTEAAVLYTRELAPGAMRSEHRP